MSCLTIASELLDLNPAGTVGSKEIVGSIYRIEVPRYVYSRRICLHDQGIVSVGKLAISRVTSREAAEDCNWS